MFAREFSFEPCPEFAAALNIVCAEMFKFAIEWSRSRKWRKTGVLWWSLVDMWPMMFNYSVVDSNFLPKQPCYDWIRQSQQPFCLLIADPATGDLELFAANDTLRAWRGEYRILSIEAEGKEREISTGAFAVEPNQNQLLRTVPRPAEQAMWIMEWRVDGRRSFNHFVVGRPPYGFEVYRDWCDRLRSLDDARRMQDGPKTF
jgi:beta-mannosidase